MLKEIEFKNFLPFRSQKVSFPMPATIAVVGKNGRGKSSMLEGILFALYGEGRNDLSKLKHSKAGDDEEMYVKLKYQLDADRVMTVKRGLRPAGSGYTMVSINKELVAKGGASPSNNSAQDFINGALGIDVDTFKLTSFFGLGVNDTLMQVKPAERLETLQKIADIAVCIKFQKLANERFKAGKNWIEKEERALEVMQDNLEDSDVLQTEVNENLKSAEAWKEEQDGYAMDRRVLLKEEDRYQGLLQEKSGLSVQRTRALKQKEQADKEVQNARVDWNDAKLDSKELIQKRTTLLEKIQGMVDCTAMQSKLNDCTIEVTKLNVSIDLRKTALSVESSKCPLCEAKLKAEMKQIWQKELKEFQITLKIIHKRAENVRRRLDIRQTADKELILIKRDLVDVVKDGDRAKTTGVKAKIKAKAFTAETEKIENRMQVIQKEMKGYDAVIHKMEIIDDKIADLIEKIGGMNESIKNLHIRLTATKNAKKQIKQVIRDIKQKRAETEGYEWVAKAFARHAIPVQLLTNLRAILESKASRIYQQFAGGLIKIVDIPGARPGVEFALHDEVGQRSYKSLSSGEKVMFFLALRVALSQVINAGHNNKVDFLILDEIAGNLDPDNREGLTRLINALLKKYFPQILLVSHVSMRDIFTKTLVVTKSNGVSKIT